MRLDALVVKNLRAVREFTVSDLPDFVVIAGANGSGKSCIFDAVRLLKSLYGGHSANEYQQWFGEFAINLQNPHELRRLFRNPAEPIVIDATVRFSPAERNFLESNIDVLAMPVAWQEVTGQPVDYWTWNRLNYVTQLRVNQREIQAATAQIAKDVRAELANDYHEIGVIINSSGDLEMKRSRLVEVAFAAYEPDSLGVIEYHGASRTYERQQVGGINLDARAFEDQRRQQRLYNSNTKYQNVKTQLASSYLRALIAKESSGGASELDDLNQTLQELFGTFFPDKEYLGARPTPSGNLEFPVRLRTGEEHDIDELSSGEKEILYGYLQLRNSTPKNSVILLDEPELHLNPRLLQGFTDFYHRHLGKAQGNQLWLVTHSDTLLQQAVGNLQYAVYHMLPISTEGDEGNQALEVLADDDVERVTLSLVGDLATYRPHGKVVILEGEGPDGFDVSVVRRLFPDFDRRVNLVSGGNKKHVRDLYAVLEAAAKEAGIRNRFYAVVDRDFGPSRTPLEGASEFTWDVYHIENYLLDPGSLHAAASALLDHEPFKGEDEVVAELRVCATQLVDRLVLERLQGHVNERLTREIIVGAAPDTTDPARDLLPSIIGSLDRLQGARGELTVEHLRELSANYRRELLVALDTDAFLRDFPGRLILRRFADRVLGGKIDSLLFSRAVLDKMVERGVKPQGMKAVIDKITGQARTSPA
jgi:predicted ATPase